MRRSIKNYIAALPLIGTEFLRMRLKHKRLGDKGIRGKMQQLAHNLDLHMTRGEKVPYSVLREFELLMRDCRTRNLSIDEAMSWALQRYVVGKYGLKWTRMSEAPPETPKEPVFSALRARRSVREWQSTKVDAKEVEACIKAAAWAPSSCNRQLWQVILINKQQDKEFLRPYFHSRFWLAAPLLILVVMNADPYGEAERHYAYLDAGAFIQSMLLALHATGYGSCWIGFAKWDCFNNIHVSMASHNSFCEHFCLGKGLLPVSMIAVGRPSIVPQPPARQDLANILIGTFLE